MSTPHFPAGEVTYTAVCEEALPQLLELVVEHRQMVREMEAIEQAQHSHFESTWSKWSKREANREASETRKPRRSSPKITAASEL